MYENNLDKFETLQKEWEVWFNDYLLKFQVYFYFNYFY